MVVYLLGTSGQPLGSIQPVQENQSMIWASLSLKKSFSIFPSKSSKFAPTHILQAPISSKSPIRWQEKQEVSIKISLKPNCSNLSFLGSPTCIRKESGTEIGNSLEFDFVVPPSAQLSRAVKLMKSA